MREKKGHAIEDLKIGKMMEEFGFKPESSSSTARALILNLVRSAYGADAAREFMRQMNLEKNRDIEPNLAIDGVGTHETQLSLFDVAAGETQHAGDDIPGIYLQKKSRRA